MTSSKRIGNAASENTRAAQLQCVGHATLIDLAATPTVIHSCPRTLARLRMGFCSSTSCRFTLTADVLPHLLLLMVIVLHGLIRVSLLSSMAVRQARAKDFKDSGKSKQETEWACKFFMWETQYEQLLKDMQAGNRQAGRLVLNHDGGKPWMGPVVPDFRVGERVLVYLGVLQALLLLLILVVVISK
ncbi:hypothetical protein OsI_25214 [Oryza sativa Indica Group]|uniref:Transmembrane protein n=1 Tax=Oryza sativa subsp. indica TaxID=39946 RepID=B8B890_ORYSI|nr:hypothetical protein OsI_25214 [Oryza sativa Indica Group]